MQDRENAFLNMLNEQEYAEFINMRSLGESDTKQLMQTGLKSEAEAAMASDPIMDIKQFVFQAKENHIERFLVDWGLLRLAADHELVAWMPLRSPTLKVKMDWPGRLSLHLRVILW